MVGHTPGPWTASDIRPDGTHIRSNSRHWSLAITFEIRGCSNPKMDIDANEERANARLIAAAPELLEALKALRIQALQSELNSPAHEWGWEALGLAHAAIAKAEGPDV